MTQKLFFLIVWKESIKRSDNNTSEMIAEINKLTSQNAKLEKLCRKLNKKLRASEKAVQDAKSQMKTGFRI